MMPSPQRRGLQSGRQSASGSVEFAVPSSHCSPTETSTWPLPHFSSDRQSAEQPSPDLLLPSSHTSCGSIVLFPHASYMHVVEQPSSAAVLPSSHCSPANASRAPSPHSASLRQSLRHCVP